MILKSRIKLAADDFLGFSGYCPFLPAFLFGDLSPKRSKRILYPDEPFFKSFFFSRVEYFNIPMLKYPTFVSSLKSNHLSKTPT